MHAKEYFVHPIVGNYLNFGMSKSEALQSLDQVAKIKLVAGDKVFLAIKCLNAVLDKKLPNN